MNLLTYLCSNTILDKAYIWSCDQSVGYSYKNWLQVRSKIKQLIFNGLYKFSPVQKYENESGTGFMLCINDAIVVRSISIVLRIALICKLRFDYINISDHREIHREISELMKFIDNMSNRSYLLAYRNTLEYDILKNQNNVFNQIDYVTNDPIITNLIEQFLNTSYKINKLIS